MRDMSKDTGLWIVRAGLERVTVQVAVAVRAQEYGSNKKQDASKGDILRVHPRLGLHKDRQTMSLVSDKIHQQDLPSDILEYEPKHFPILVKNTSQRILATLGIHAPIDQIKYFDTFLTKNLPTALLAFVPEHRPQVLLSAGYDGVWWEGIETAMQDEHNEPNHTMLLQAVLQLLEAPVRTRKR